MKFFIGPMSKNIVDTIIDFVNNTSIDITFIPSRRQIDYKGGYVNNWTTKDFCEYVKQKSNNKILIERDHGGPGQGSLDDDGLESLKEDCNYMDIIHIDPWKKYPLYDEGLHKTIELINFCYSQNPNIIYEIGTEEGIRPFLEEELDKLVSDIKDKLSIDVFSKIKYLVIQCGTKLLEKENIGTYNETKLQKMLEVCHKYNLIPKEHNGDWITMDVVHSKKNYGLECINIAPEFGEIETNILLKNINNIIEDYETLFNICLKSEKWKKWVSDDFIPEQNKEKLIKICGHYVISNNEFIKLKNKYLNIDQEIKDAIYKRLLELNNLFTRRTKCIICQNTNFNESFKQDNWSPIKLSLFNKNINRIFIPYNILECNICKTFQTKYLGKLDIIYENNHVDAFGTVKSQMFDEFGNYIIKNNDINSILEIGACTDTLAQYMLDNRVINYTIVEPSYKGSRTKIKVIENYIENIDIDSLKIDTIIMSHVLEHLYNPIEIIDKISKSNIKYLYINHPNLEYYCKNNITNILNIEHIFYIENQFLLKLLEKYGFIYNPDDIFNYNNHSLFIKFTKGNRTESSKIIVNNTSTIDVKKYFEKMTIEINKINSLIEDKSIKYYIWPASAHTITLFNNGLNYKNIYGLLDNSPNKIGKKIYGYDLECFNFNEIIRKSNSDVSVILVGGENYRKELDLTCFKGSIIVI